MFFYSRVNRPLTICSYVGDGLSPVYDERIVDGVRKLVKVKDEPMNEFVQKSLPDTLVYNILDKFNRGNVDVLNKTAGQFFDSTQFPTTLADAQNILIKAEKHFYGLPSVVKRDFDNSPVKFVEAVFDGSIFEKYKNNTEIQGDGKQVSVIPENNKEV